MTPSKNNSKAQSSNQSIFIKPTHQFIPKLLHNNIISPLNLILKSRGMCLTYHKVQFPKVKHTIDDDRFGLLYFLWHDTFLEDGIGYASVCEVE